MVAIFTTGKKNLLIINAILLYESSNNKPSFQSFKGSICFTFGFINPLATNSFLVGRKRYLFLGIINLQGLNFFVHSFNPAWMLDSLFINGWLREFFYSKQTKTVSWRDKDQVTPTGLYLRTNISLKSSWYFVTSSGLSRLKKSVGRRTMRW